MFYYSKFKSEVSILRHARLMVLSTFSAAVNSDNNREKHMEVEEPPSCRAVQVVLCTFLAAVHAPRGRGAAQGGECVAAAATRRREAAIVDLGSKKVQGFGP